jgi:hypothetical protein
MLLDPHFFSPRVIIQMASHDVGEQYLPGPSVERHPMTWASNICQALSEGVYELEPKPEWRTEARPMPVIIVY